MSATTTYASRRLSMPEVRELNTVLHDKDIDNELTALDLSEAIKCLYEVNGELRSVGIEHILYYRRGIKLIMSPEQLTELFMAHLDNPAITKVIMASSLFDLLDERPTGLTSQLIQEITARHPMPDCTWIRTVSLHRMGITKEAILAAIMAQLDESRFSLEQSRPFAESFLLHGAGSHVLPSRRHYDIDENPYYELYDSAPMWCVVPEDKFYGVVERCIRRAPETMFVNGQGDRPMLQDCLLAVRPSSAEMQRYAPYMSQKLKLMLTHSELKDLRDLAASLLKTLKDLSIRLLMELSFAQQKAIVEAHLPDSLEFLVRATLEVDYYESERDQDDRRSLFDEHFEKLPSQDGAEVFQVYRTLHFFIRQSMSDSEVGQLASDIDLILRDRLASLGYYIGTIKQEHSARYGMQSVFYATIGGKDRKIIQNGRQRRKFLTDDLVYADANTDPHLATRVQAREYIVFANFHYFDESREALHHN